MSPDDGTARDAGALHAGGAAPGSVPGEVVEGVVALPRDPGALEELIAARRENLAAAIDELVVRAHPKEMARRSVADVKARVRGFATTPEGELATERLAAVAAAAVAFVGLVLMLRSRHGGAR